MMSKNYYLNDIIKILLLPEDIIRNIASYLIMKIPKNDHRYQLLDAHYRNNIDNRVHIRYSSITGKSFFYDITFSNPKYTHTIRRYYDDFITYQFKNTVTNEIHSDRCWFNLKDMNWRHDSTNYWQQFFIDGWLPNPNTTATI